MEKQKVYDVHKLWTDFTSNKRWFLLSVILCLICAVLYVYFTRPMYSVTGKMLVTEKKNSSGGTSSAVALLSSQLPLGLGSSLGGAIGVENEKEILNSKLLARNVVNRLNLYTEYRICRFLKSSLVYKTQPVDVSVSPELIQFMDDELPMKVHKIKLSLHKSEDGYRVEGLVKSGKKESDIPEQSFAKLPFVVKTDIGNLTLSENKSLTEEQQKPYKKDYRLEISVIPSTTAARIFSKRLAISTASKKATNTVNLSMRDESILRGYDYINCLVEEYNKFSTDEKHKEVSKYDQFVKERLAMVDRDLGLNDENWENFKKRYQVTDVKVDAEEIIKKKSSYESQIVGLGIQLQLLNYLKEYVDDPANIYEIIPVSMGNFTSSTSSTADASSSNTNIGDAVTVIVRHNSLVTERNLLLKSATEKSPQVERLTAMIDELQPVIKTALRRDIESIRLRSSSMEREYGKYMGRVSDAPEQERILTEIGRQRKVKEGVYLSLLQKREENAMDLINTVDKGRLIDMVQYNSKVKPRTKIVLLLSLVIGLLLPFIVIALSRWLKGTVRGTYDLEELTKLPVLGEIHRNSVQTDESFLSIRSNLLHQLGEGRKVVLVTSDNQGDGKTYNAVLLAKSLSEAGKRVVLCDLNFRHPSLAKVLGIQQGSGLGQLLMSETVTQEQVLSKLVKPDSALFDVLVAGDPLNVHPANLLAHETLWTVMNVLRHEYDLVILDTPSVGLYNDVLIDGLSDVTYYICRSGKTPKTAVMRLEKLAGDNRLSNPCIVVNHL